MVRTKVQVTVYLYLYLIKITIEFWHIHLHTVDREKRENMMMHASEIRLMRVRAVPPARSSHSFEKKNRCENEFVRIYVIITVIKIQLKKREKKMCFACAHSVCDNLTLFALHLAVSASTIAVLPLFKSITNVMCIYLDDSNFNRFNVHFVTN